MPQAQKTAAANVLKELKLMHVAVAQLRKIAEEPLDQPMPPGTEQKVAPLLQELLQRVSAIEERLGKYETAVKNFAANA